jgi:GT2 family glycosyltransferase
MTIPSAAIGAVIVTYNSARYLAEVLDGLAHQTFRDFTVLIVDNASRPEERPDPKRLPANVHLLQSEDNLGFAAANNRAVGLLDTPLIAFLNPDAFPAPDWLERLDAAQRRFPDHVAFGSRQTDADDTTLLDGVGDVMHASGLCYRAGYGRAHHGARFEGETFSACAAAMLVRRDAFLAVGGFDERFFCFVEDVDLGFRLRLRGGRIMQLDDARVRHVGGGSTGKRSAFADYYGARNRLWTFVKNMPAPLLWPLLPAHAAMTLATLSVWTLQGRGSAGWRGLRDGLMGLGPILTARRGVQAARRAPIGDIARALSWSPFAAARRAPVLRDPARVSEARFPAGRRRSKDAS